jgi:hypothetical protein
MGVKQSMAAWTRFELAFACALVIAGPAHAQVDWDGLPEGRWTVVSSNTLSDVDPCPSGSCSYSAVEGQSGVINDWCGGAFAANYGELGGLIAWGGGHNGYFGSEVYVFDLATGSWERVSEPYDDGSSSVAAQCNEDGVYPDGSACPTHTYDQVDYHPATNRFVILGGTPDPVCGGCVDDRAHLFDLTGLDWQLGAKKDGPVYYGGTSAYDAERDLFWLLSAYAHSFASYDAVADTWTDHGSPGNVEIDGAAVVDPERDLYLFIDARGTGNLYAISLDAPDSDFVELNVAGDTEIQSADKLGFDRDSSTGRFVGWDDGADLYVLDAPEGDWRTGIWRWTRIASSDTSVVPERNENGTYGRLRYAASVNAFVLVSSTEGAARRRHERTGLGHGRPRWQRAAASGCKRGRCRRAKSRNGRHAERARCGQRRRAALERYRPLGWLRLSRRLRSRALSRSARAGARRAVFRAREATARERASRRAGRVSLAVARALQLVCARGARARAPPFTRAAPLEQRHMSLHRQRRSRPSACMYTRVLNETSRDSTLRPVCVLRERTPGLRFRSSW